MAEFDPVPPPLNLPAVPDILSPLVPLNPPMVGTASPFFPVDGENRDLVLDSIRVWIRTVLLAWTQAWETQLTDWEGDVATQLDAWLTEAAAYITEHAVSGLSFRTTVTPIAGAGTTNVVLVVDTNLRPITVGDLVLDQAVDGNYGIVTALIDDTHATVTYVGSLRGPQGIAGLSFRTTATDIASGGGTTDVVLALTPNRPLTVTDLIVDQSPDSNWGIVTVVIDATHATVAQVGSFRGATGATGPAGADGTNGTNGADGIMHSIIAGDGVHVDSTDPANPIVSVVSAATWYYTDPSDMNDSIGTGPKNGDVGTLVMTGAHQINSVWVVSGNKWTAVSASVESWITDWDLALDLSTNTNLILDGVVATENVNGTQLRWNPAAQTFAQEKGQNRFPGAIGGNTAPSGSLVFNPDNSMSLTACTIAEVTAIAPNIAIDGTADWEMRLWGVVEANAVIALYLSGTSDGPQLDGYPYASFGPTTQVNGDTLTHDTDMLNTFGGGSEHGWPIAYDTTGSPIYLDCTIVVRHATEPGQPVTGTIHSLYYDSELMTVMFDKTSTIYLYDYSNVHDGFYISFSEAFTGTAKLKAI